MRDDGRNTESLRRGDVVLAPDPFTDDGDAMRPWAVVNNESHPFDGKQYVAMALTTKTWYEDRVSLADEDYREGQAPVDSSLVPHALTSLRPTFVTEHVCRLARKPVDEAVACLHSYLVAGS